LCPRGPFLHGSGELCTDENINPLCKVFQLFHRTIIGSKPDVVIGVSEFVLNTHLKYGFFKKSKKFVLHNSMNYRHPVKNKDKTTIDIVYVGHMYKAKGIHILIDAFKKIKNDNLKLHILGSGNFMEKLKKLSGNDKRIVFYGELSNDDVQKFHSEISDILVLPSISYEAFPTVTIEAFSHGVPVVASKIGGIPEAVKDGYNGFLFEPGDSSALRRALEKLVKTPDLLEKLSKNALEAAKEYDESEHTKKLAEIYKQAIEIRKNS